MQILQNKYYLAYMKTYQLAYRLKVAPNLKKQFLISVALIYSLELKAYDLEH